MIKRLTKKAIIKGMSLAYENGYFSDEVKNYLDNFDFSTRVKLDTVLKSLYNSCQVKSSRYYQLALDNNLI